jgi:hypothetical protein
VPAISQPIAINGQLSRNCRVMKATSSPQRAMRDRQHAQAAHPGKHELRIAADHCPQRCQRPVLGQLGLAQSAGVGAERAEQFGAPAEGLDHPDTEHRLLDTGGQVAGQVLGMSGLLAVGALVVPGDRHQRQHHRRSGAACSGRW